MKWIEKLFRFLKNPWPYFVFMGPIFRNSGLVCWFYKTVLIRIALLKISRKKQVNVVFLAMNTDMWRYDGVYRRMAKDPRFNPVIVTAMRANVPMKLQLNEQDEMLQLFQEKGYKVLPGYDCKKQVWVKLKSLQPDVIFYTQPYYSGIYEGFEYYHYPLSLICYSPYSFQLSKADWNWNNALQNCAWRQYFVGPYQVKLSKELSKSRGQNARAVGYCLEEEYADFAANVAVQDAAWHHDQRKRIIWAPHHSVYKSEMFKVSSFLEIADAMVSLREKYSNKVVFAFKPHPVLQSKLYDIWGKERTDAYYQGWAKGENSFYAPGAYQALFAGSDAMIHCSGSFIVEYLYTNKPVHYVYSQTRNPPELGEIGDAALDAHYKAHQVSDIDQFIENVVLNGNDSMRVVRADVAKHYLRSPTAKMFSQNVVDDIIAGLGWR